MKGKGWKISAVVLCAVFYLAACQTVPLHKLPAAKVYTNNHGITFAYPETWHVEDATINYKDLDAAALEGGAYLQLYSYDRGMAENPGMRVPVSEIKIMISMSRNLDKLDFSQVLGGLGNDVVEKAVFMINKRPAYKVHYRIMSQESGEKLDILSIISINKNYIIKFICYPWNSRYVRQFEELAASFRNRRVRQKCGCDGRPLPPRTSRAHEHGPLALEQRREHSVSQQPFHLRKTEVPAFFDFIRIRVDLPAPGEGKALRILRFKAALVQKSVKELRPRRVNGQLFPRFPQQCRSHVLSGAHVTSHGRIPQPGVGVLPHRSFLQVQPALPGRTRADAQRGGSAGGFRGTPPVMPPHVGVPFLSTS